MKQIKKNIDKIEEFEKQTKSFSNYKNIFLISLLLSIFIVMVVGFFSTNQKFINSINFLSIPIVILSVLLVISKIYYKISIKAKLFKESYTRMASDALDLSKKYESLGKEQGKEYTDKIEELLKSFSSRFDDAKHYDFLRAKFDKRYKLISWFCVVPTTFAMVPVFLSDIIQFPLLNINVLSLASLFIIIFDLAFSEEIIYHYFEIVSKNSRNKTKKETAI